MSVGSSKIAERVYPSRTSSRVAGSLRHEIERGHVSPGSFLPSERDLAAKHGVSAKSVRRALKLLEAEALVTAESRRGYRVLRAATDPERGDPLAYLVSDPPFGGMKLVHRWILNALQAATGGRGWALLGVPLDGRTPGEVVTQLRAARVCGVVSDSGAEPALLSVIAELGIPVVLADPAEKEMQVDTVVQDGFMGGFLAASWLVARGHKRVAFFGYGPAGVELRAVERYCGVVGGLARAGLELRPDMTVSVPPDNFTAALDAAKRLLSRPDRPTGVVAPWQGPTGAVASASRELGIEFGGDFEMVGWSTEEDYGADFRIHLHGGVVPPTVVWSVRALAEACITRLQQRRAEPGLPVTLIKIPARIRPAAELTAH